MQEIGSLLPSVFKRQIQRGDPRLAQVLVPLWPRVAGAAVAQHSRPIRFGGGTLILETDGDGWAAQLQALSGEIQAQVNRFLGGPVIQRVKVRSASAARRRAEQNRPV